MHYANRKIFRDAAQAGGQAGERAGHTWHHSRYAEEILSFFLSSFFLPNTQVQLTQGESRWKWKSGFGLAQWTRQMSEKAHNLQQDDHICLQINSEKLNQVTWAHWIDLIERSMDKQGACITDGLDDGGQGRFSISNLPRGSAYAALGLAILMLSYSFCSRVFHNVNTSARFLSFSALEFVSLCRAHVG